MSILASSLTLGSADYEWRDGAICRDTDPELFFPVGTTGNALVQIDRAKQVCGECGVAQACLDFALDTNQDSGIWGGLTEEERRVIRRRRVAASRAAASADEPAHGPIRPQARSTGYERRSVVGRHAEPDHGAVARARAFAEAGRIEVVGRSPSGSRSVPLSSVVTSVRTIDSPSPVAWSRSNDGSTPLTVVDHTDVELLSIPVGEQHHHLAAPPALGEAVIDGVLQQLGEHDRQRRGVRAGIRPPSPDTENRTGRSGDCRPFLGEPQQRPHDLDEGDVLARLA